MDSQSVRGLAAWLALLLALAPATRAADAGGAAKAGENRNAPVASTKGELPWPEPAREAVAKTEAELRQQLPAAQFCFTRVGPWVVATDWDAGKLAQFMESCVRFYAGRIQRQLFAKPLSEPVKVYLFQDSASYNAWSEKLFGGKPHTPFGWFSREKRAMVMNIGTGGGTLLHEMVHAMVEADFPECPAWLNEGLGSLFEASSRDRDGKVIGVTNWRLKGLQEELQKNAAPRFAKLLAMADTEFYGPQSSTNYAAVRYLMQYLQENGKLETFYARIRDKKDDDALATLRSVFDHQLTVEQIEKNCYDWVKLLRR
jgi:hypothetical protein